MLNSIGGRSVIVTGGSKGIGRGIARVFAAKGARVLVVARNIGEAEATAHELRAAGGEALALAADVSNWPDAQRIAAEATAQIGGIDILCTNAASSQLRRGTAIEVGPVSDATITPPMARSLKFAWKMASAQQTSDGLVGARAAAPEPHILT